MHAEIIMFKIDASFGSDNENAHEADWLSLNSRKPTMDMVTLIHDVIAAYIKKKRDDSLTQITIWDNDYDRNQVAEKYMMCLRNDEENKEGGKGMPQEAKRIFGSNQSRVRAGSLESSHLDLREIVTHMLDPHEEAWIFDNPTTSKKKVHVAAIQHTCNPTPIFEP